jgi:hypothetical protein
MYLSANRGNAIEEVVNELCRKLGLENRKHIQYIVYRGTIQAVTSNKGKEFG